MTRRRDLWAAVGTLQLGEWIIALFYTSRPDKHKYFIT